MFSISCEEGEKPVPPVDETEDPIISFGQETLSIPAEGGEMSVAFELLNPVEGNSPSAEAEADWILVSSVDEEAMVVNFNAGRNDGFKSRETNLVLTYVNKVSDTLRLIQAEAVKSFAINVTDSTVTSFAYEILPVDTTMTYFSQVVEKEYFDGFESPEDFIAADMELVEQLASESGMTFEQCLQNMLLKGNYDKEIRRQLPGKQFVIYAFGLDGSGNLLTGLHTREASTIAVEQSDITFDIEISQEGRNTTVNIIPSDDEQTYMAEIVDAETFHNMPGGYIFGYRQSIIWDNIDMYTSMQMPDPYAITLGYFAEQGEYTMTEELTAGTDYVVFAVSINEQCLLNSEPEVVEFHTDDVVMSDNVITLEIQNVETRIIDVKVTTTNDDPYVLYALEAAPYKGLTDEEILENISSRYNFTNMIKSGDLTKRLGFPNMDFEPCTEYLVFAYGFDMGNPTTDIVYEYVTTTEAKQSDMTFELVYHGYYAGAEVQEAYPENFTADISGHAVYHVKAQATPEDRLHYKYYTVLTGDWTDTEEYTDEEAIAELLNLWETTIGVSWDYNMILLKYDMDFTFIGYAIDVAGNPTAVWRHLVHPTEDGTVPMGGFDPGNLWNWDYSLGTDVAGGNGWMIPLIQ